MNAFLQEEDVLKPGESNRPGILRFCSPVPSNQTNRRDRRRGAVSRAVDGANDDTSTTASESTKRKLSEFEYDSDDSRPTKKAKNKLMLDEDSQDTCETEIFRGVSVSKKESPVCMKVDVIPMSTDDNDADVESAKSDVCETSSARRVKKKSKKMSGFAEILQNIRADVEGGNTTDDQSYDVLPKPGATRVSIGRKSPISEKKRDASRPAPPREVEVKDMRDKTDVPLDTHVSKKFAPSSSSDTSLSVFLAKDGESEGCRNHVKTPPSPGQMEATWKYLDEKGRLTPVDMVDLVDKWEMESKEGSASRHVHSGEWLNRVERAAAKVSVSENYLKINVASGNTASVPSRSSASRQNGVTPTAASDFFDDNEMVIDHVDVDWQDIPGNTSKSSVGSVVSTGRGSDTLKVQRGAVMLSDESAEMEEKNRDTSCVVEEEMEMPCVAEFVQAPATGAENVLTGAEETSPGEGASMTRADDFRTVELKTRKPHGSGTSEAAGLDQNLVSTETSDEDCVAIEDSDDLVNIQKVLQRAKALNDDSSASDAEKSSGAKTTSENGSDNSKGGEFNAQKFINNLVSVAKMTTKRPNVCNTEEYMTDLAKRARGENGVQSDNRNSGSVPSLPGKKLGKALSRSTDRSVPLVPAEVLIDDSDDSEQASPGDDAPMPWSETGAPAPDTATTENDSLACDINDSVLAAIRTPPMSERRASLRPANTPQMTFTQALAFVDSPGSIESPGLHRNSPAPSGSRIGAEISPGFGRLNRKLHLSDAMPARDGSDSDEQATFDLGFTISDENDDDSDLEVIPPSPEASLSGSYRCLRMLSNGSLSRKPSTTLFGGVRNGNRSGEKKTFQTTKLSSKGGEESRARVVKSHSESMASRPRVDKKGYYSEGALDCDSPANFKRDLNDKIFSQISSQIKPEAPPVAVVIPMLSESNTDAVSVTDKKDTPANGVENFDYEMQDNFDDAVFDHFDDGFPSTQEFNTHQVAKEETETPSFEVDQANIETVDPRLFLDEDSEKEENPTLNEADMETVDPQYLDVYSDSAGGDDSRSGNEGADSSPVFKLTANLSE